MQDQERCDGREPMVLSSIEISSRPKSRGQLTRESQTIENFFTLRFFTLLLLLIPSASASFVVASLLFSTARSSTALSFCFILLLFSLSYSLFSSYDFEVEELELLLPLLRSNYPILEVERVLLWQSQRAILVVEQEAFLLLLLRFVEY